MNILIIKNYYKCIKIIYFIIKYCDYKILYNVLNLYKKPT